MKTRTFGRVVVPLEFEAVGESEIAAGRSYELRPGQWVSLAPATVAALSLAGQLAAEEVILVHATPDLAASVAYIGAENGWVGNGSLLDVEASARTSALNVLTRIGDKMFEGVAVSPMVATGRPLDVIMQASEEHRPDAIVLAASARGRIRRAVIGSTADRVLRLASCPVIVIPAPPQ